MRLLLDRERFSRALPFAAVAVLGQASAALPPGPGHLHTYWLSCVLLFLVGGTVVLTPPIRSDRWLLTGLAYVGSVACLMLATGGVGSGLGSLLLLPVVGLGLYGRRRDSVVTVAALMITLFCVSLASPHVDAATARRTVIFGAVGAMLSVAIHALRDRLELSNERTTHLLRQAEAMNIAAAQMTILPDPETIVNLALDLVVQVSSPPGGAVRRAYYYLIRGARAELVTSTDSSEALSPSRVLVADLPSVRQVVEGAGGAWVPVLANGTLHGVLVVEGAGGDVSPDCLDRCVALGHLVELALSNWTAHQRLELQATTEERRRIARELHDGLAHELAFIASKAKRAGSSQLPPGDLRDLAGAADRALDEARRAITVLASAHPQRLTQAVTETAEDLGARLGLAVQVDVVDEVDTPPAVTEQLLRIVREAVTNAGTHGGARRVRVAVERRDGVRLTLDDDGCGFEPDVARSSGGFGLVSMRERAATVGASFAVESAPGCGTRIEVVLH